MTTSNVAIANRALQLLGAERIESLSQDHPNARSINACFNQVRDAELRRYDWAFAIGRASIAADATDTLWGSWNRYVVPGDFIRLLLDDESDTVVDWRIEGLRTEGEEPVKVIVTKDASPLEIRYIARIEDPNMFDELFSESFACKLAFQTCKEITGSNALQNEISGYYKTAINDAKRLGSIERAEKDPPEDEWIEVRR